MNLNNLPEEWVSVIDPVSERTSRRVKKDLTPDEVSIDKPDEFDFSYIQSERLPDGVQYTLEFDQHWVYTNGSADGGSRDDIPVQGIEIGVLASRKNVEPTILAILDAVSLYYEDTGQYPRHRIIKTMDDFKQNSKDGIGLIGVFQPAPDDYDGLMDHMMAMQDSKQGTIDSNIEMSRHLVQYLAMCLVDAEVDSQFSNSELAGVTGWESPQQLGSLPIVQHYAALGGSKIYNPQKQDIDFRKDGVSSVEDSSIDPQELGISQEHEIFDD